MNFLPHILAEDSDVFMKLIFGVIAVVIWGVSALASMISKQQQEAKRKRIRDTMQPIQRQASQASTPQRVPIAPRPTPRQIAEGIAYRHPEVLRQPMPPMRPRPMSAPPLPLPVPVRSRSMSPKPQQKKSPSRKRQRERAVEEPILELSEERDSIAPRSAARSPIEAPIAAPRTPVVDAFAIRQWMTPRTLRSQFILTELLQPPLAMREERE